MFILAPMADVTDTVFRQIIARVGPPDIFFTEFVNVDGLCSPGRDRLEPLLYKEPGDVPIVAQIWGNNPDNYYRVATELVESGFAGVDINMGCPARVITRKGGCSALAQPDLRPQAATIIAAVKDAVQGRVPVSVKARLGWRDTDRSWTEFLLKQGIDRLTIHGRTTKEMSRPPARWDEIAAVVRQRDEMGLSTAIIGNGDVASIAEAVQKQDYYRVDGVMIGRAIFQNPFLFSPDPDAWLRLEPAAKIQLFADHLDLFDQTYPDRQRQFVILKKFMKVYINGFARAAQMRQVFAQATDIQAGRDHLRDFKQTLASHGC